MRTIIIARHPERSAEVRGTKSKDLVMYAFARPHDRREWDRAEAINARCRWVERGPSTPALRAFAQDDVL